MVTTLESRTCIMNIHVDEMPFQKSQTSSVIPIMEYLTNANQHSQISPHNELPTKQKKSIKFSTCGNAKSPPYI